MSVASAYVIHDDHCFLRQSIRSFSAAGPVFAFVSRAAWHGEPGDWEECARIVENAGATVVVGD